MPRVFYPAFRGIIIRGIERRKIFRDNKCEDWGLLLTLTNIPYESRADPMDFSKGNPFSDFLSFRV